MPRPASNYPNSIWDGDTVNPDRDGFENQAKVTARDFAHLSSELIATQEQTYNHENLFRVPQLLTMQWEENQNTGLNTLGGGLTATITGNTLNSGNNIVIAAKNCCRMLLVINAASDAEGTITITGNRLDILTGNKVTGTEVITVNGVSQDNSSTTVAGTQKWDISGAYQTHYAFCDEVTVNTTDCNISDIDIYNFWRRLQPQIEVATLDAVIVTGVPTNLNAEMDCIVYIVTVDDELEKRKCNVTPAVHQEFDGTFTIHEANSLIALDRAGDLGTVRPVNAEGMFVNVLFYPIDAKYWESVMVNVWTSWYYKQTQDPFDYSDIPGLS